MSRRPVAHSFDIGGIPIFEVFRVGLEFPRAGIRMRLAGTPLAALRLKSRGILGLDRP